MVTIESENQASSLDALLSPIKPDGYTDVKAAFQDAANMLNGASTQPDKPFIVFLTDGQPEIPNPYPDYESETLNLAKSLNVPVLAIALTHSAQTPFLDRLAEITGGSVISAKSASDLLDAYLEVFRRIKDRTILGSGQNIAPTTTSVFLDPALVPYIQKASFVIGKSEKISAVLYAPDGTALNSSKLGALSDTTDPAFTTITVDHPMGGSWVVHLDGSGKAVVRAIFSIRNYELKLFLRDLHSKQASLYRLLYSYWRIRRMGSQSRSLGPRTSRRSSPGLMAHRKASINSMMTELTAMQKLEMATTHGSM